MFGKATHLQFSILKISRREQKGAKFSAVQTKMSCLQSVMEGLCKLSNVDINNVDECLRVCFALFYLSNS